MKKQKAVKRGAKKFFRKREPSGPIGQVSVVGEYLEVDFVYSVERVAAIKSIPQARFHRETKRWTVPLKNREILERSTLLGRTELAYEFDAERTPEQSLERQEAETRWKNNPFSVSEADIALLRPELIFTLNANESALRAKPRFRSVAQTLLERLGGVHYLKNEKSYFFPVERLNEFLRDLRDRAVTFAVEQNAASRLIEGGEFRGRVKSGEAISVEELNRALLVPYIDGVANDSGELLFRLCAYTTEQLRECFPKIANYQSRRTHANGFDAAELATLLSRKSRLQFQLWLSADANWHSKHLQHQLREQTQRSSPLSSALVRFLEREASWVVSEEAEAGLIIREDVYTRIFPKKASHPLSAFERRKETTGEQTYFFFPVAGPEIEELKIQLDAYLSERGEVLFESTEEFSQLLLKLSTQKKLREHSRLYRQMSDTVLPELPDFPSEFATRLFPHQRVAVEWLLSSKRSFLGDDMGLGKTLTVLTTFEILSRRNEVDFLLVICPNSLSRNWLREAKNWFPERRLTVLPEEKREKILLLKRIGWNGIAVHGLVVNYESIRLDYVREGVERLLTERKAMLCLDESQRVKNPAGKTFEALKTLVPYCERRVLLSGTPTPKSLSDIWAQMYLLDDGERFGENYFHWLSGVAELGNRYSDYAVKKYRPLQVKETVARVQEILLRRKKEDVLSLPAKTFITREVELKGDQAKRYEEVRGELLLRMTSLNGKTFLREINNMLEEYLRAVQIASNPRLVDSNWKGTPQKFVELDFLLEEIVAEREEKVVVWTNYLGNVAELVRRYSQYGARALSGEVPIRERDELVHAFQHGDEVKVLVAVPAAGGVGLTLTRAQTAIYVEKTWNAEHWLQSIDRIHRIGQRGTVRIISLQASKIDELISLNLYRKYRNQAALLGDLDGREGAREIAAELEEVPTREELINALTEFQKPEQLCEQDSL